MIIDEHSAKEKKEEDLNINISSNSYSKAEIDIPLNVVKEKVVYCLPPDAKIEDEAVIAISHSLKYFLKELADKIPKDTNEEKKILVKDIKTCIESEQIFCFLKKLIEK